MAEWIAAEKRGRNVRMWAMPEGAPVEDAMGTVVMVGGDGAPRRAVPCKAIPEGLVPGAGGGFLFPALEWEGQPSDGAEARIAGFAARDDRWDGVLCIVGESTVWAHISAGEVISFQRFVTARLAAAIDVSEMWDDIKLREAMADAMARPERLAAYVARAGDAGTLWGALLGAELAAAKPYWLGQQVVVIGEGRAAEALAGGLAGQGVPVMRADDTDMVLEGMKAAVAAHGGVA
ncbi:2-dehydro-3-deoxygalactonokinase [Shimia sp. CNT1-13L.2]|uniref:2-dehydro-3-deoxygalactonokinase n=1 Tax=Shimia sp. CNT1-13L.2 TaxID=2959663 RepID=UPI0020CDC3FE|nr:2-dehydro-3-deoxygalactonokinase [Shimia sp. CNT1-13L.2]MCP9480349.1 2-dehydro-3-deoxygalactonokinase [Shimia sp. CNT1-13L.2]